MFWVNQAQEDRHSRIRGFVNENDVVIALLLACADFEWTARRVIIAVSDAANVDVRSELEQPGFGFLPKLWAQHVTPKVGKRMSECVADWTQIFLPRSDPEHHKTAFGTRNRLIHGNAGGLGLEQGSKLVETLLSGSKSMATLSEEHGCPVYGERIRVVTRKPTTR